MANCCNLDICIRYVSLDSDNLARLAIQRNENYARSQESALYIGSEDQYLFDHCLDFGADNDPTVYFQGWTKWSLPTWAAFDIISYFQSFGELDYAKLAYHEFGEGVCGFFEYINGALSHTYVDTPPSYPAFDNDEDWDAWYANGEEYQLWDDALENNSVTVAVTEDTVQMYRERYQRALEQMRIVVNN